MSEEKKIDFCELRNLLYEITDLNESAIAVLEKVNIKEFYGKENHTVIEEDLFNLKYIEYNIRYGSIYYRHGILKTLRKVIKNLEKEGKQ